MKTVNKIIMCACVVAYFAGLWIIASRFGFVKLLVRYGVSGVFEEIPKTFPEVKYLYYGLGLYTLLFIIVACVVYAVITRHSKEQDDLQQEAASVAGYAERMNGIASDYRFSIREETAAERSAMSSIQALQRRIASLPPAAVRDEAIAAALEKTVVELRELVSGGCDTESLAGAVDKAMVEIEALKRKCVTIK